TRDPPSPRIIRRMVRRGFMLLGLALLAIRLPAQGYDWREGDLIFQTSRSRQSLAIQKATHSQWSHMGVVWAVKGKPVVFEAVEPVRLTPLPQWIARGEDGHFAVKRLRDAESRLTPETKRKMQTIGRRWLGRHYDLAFDWSDDRLYCSELVWKLYRRGANIELAPPGTLREADLRDPVVKKLLRERYGKRIPLDAPVISPQALFDSALLETVKTP